ILDEALEAAVKLSHRYIPARQLPDKSVSLLDTACARVAISQHAVPAEVDDTRKRIQALETDLGIIAREKNVGVDVNSREEAGSALEESANQEAEAKAAPVAGEAPLDGAERAAALEQLKGLQAQLAELQGEHPLILASVDQQAVGSVVSDWTGIPVGRMVKSEVETVMNLAKLMGQ